MKLLFEDFSLEPGLNELRRAGRLIPLPPKVFDLLCLLITNRDALVTKDLMVAQVWSGRVVSDSTLGSHVNAVRGALGDDGVQQRIVRTSARKGYRFVAEVTTLDDERPSGNACSNSGSRGFAFHDNGLPLVKIAPFLAHGPERADGHFASGLREELILNLSRMPSVDVTGSAPVAFEQSDRRQEAPEYGIEASVRSWRGRRRISVRMCDAEGNYLWADRIDVDEGDEIAAQEHISDRVAAALAACLKKSEVSRVLRKRADVRTYYDHFVLGQSLMERRGRTELQCAMAAFHKSMALNPDFGPAYGAAAWALVMKKQALWMEDVERESAEGAKLAQLAVNLSDDDSTALVRGSYALGHFGEDLDVCGAYMEKALRIAPGSAFAWALAGGQLLSAGRRGDALARIARASQANPTDAEKADISILKSLAHLLDSQSEEATEFSQAAFLLDPNNPRALALKAVSNFNGGRINEAGRAMHLFRRHNPLLRAAGVRNWVHLRNSEDLQMFTESLRGAGLPA